MGDLDDAADRLRREADAAEDRFRRMYEGVARSGWNFHLGPVHVSWAIGSQRITHVYLLALGVAIAVGVPLMFVSMPWPDLGFALVVGAFFGGSSFVAQVWAAQQAEERHISNAIWRDPALAKLAEMAAEQRGRDERLARLEQEIAKAVGGRPATEPSAE